jgi:hypothetical protein
MWKVWNVLLPSLLRLIEHLVVLLPSFESKNIGYGATYDMMVRHCLAIATVAAAPFVGDGKLNSGTFGCGCLLDWITLRGNEDGVESQEPCNLSVAYKLQECSLPPALSESIMMSNFMQRSVVDWSVPSAHFVTVGKCSGRRLKKDPLTNATKQNTFLPTYPNRSMVWQG